MQIIGKFVENIYEHWAMRKIVWRHLWLVLYDMFIGAHNCIHLR